MIELHILRANEDVGILCKDSYYSIATQAQDNTTPLHTACGPLDPTFHPPVALMIGQPCLHLQACLPTSRHAAIAFQSAPLLSHAHFCTPVQRELPCRLHASNNASSIRLLKGAFPPVHMPISPRKHKDASHIIPYPQMPS